MSSAEDRPQGGDALRVDEVRLPGIGVRVTASTKIFTGWWAARRAGVGPMERVRAGTAIVARGEFNIVIAGLAATVEPRLGPLAAAYVLILAVAGPIIARLGEPLAHAVANHRGKPAQASVG